MIEYKVMIDWSDILERYVFYTLSPNNLQIIVIEICSSKNIFAVMKNLNDNGFSPIHTTAKTCRPLYKIRGGDDTRFDDIDNEYYEIIYRVWKKKK